jgi:hypothetical protein
MEFQEFAFPKYPLLTSCEGLCFEMGSSGVSHPTMEASSFVQLCYICFLEIKSNKLNHRGPLSILLNVTS